MKKLLLFSLLAAVLTSCSTRIGDFTLVSTKNIDITKSTYKIAPSRVKGVDKKHMIICFPTGTPNAKEAIDQAIEAAGPNCVGLSDAVIDHTFWWIPYIYGQVYYEAEGNPIMKK
ncbi:MAG: hypothetical protein Q4F35_08530 [Akkermansia sp.]|nr:hypothetical protein [Akkermansia sp.]